MLIIRVPYRIPLSGGGTDLSFYYKKKGGLFISSTFNQYIFVSILLRPIDNKILIQSSNTQITDDIFLIKNKIIKETLRYFKIKNKIQVGTFATLPSSTGLGSSSSLTVGLVHAILKLFKKKRTKKKIAKIAYLIERKRLKFTGGWQDQISASFGGLIKVKIKKNGDFTVKKLKINSNIIKKIEKNFILVNAGYPRNSSKVIESQKKNIKNTIKIYDKIKLQVNDFEKALIKGDYKKIGKIFHEQWLLKKGISDQISNSKINKIYSNLLKEKSFIGGKLIGAGGGGFFLMVSKNTKSSIKFLKKNKYNFLKFRFTEGGTDQIVNTGELKYQNNFLSNVK